MLGMETPPTAINDRDIILEIPAPQDEASNRGSVQQNVSVIMVEDLENPFANASKLTKTESPTKDTDQKRTTTQ